MNKLLQNDSVTLINKRKKVARVKKLDTFPTWATSPRLLFEDLDFFRLSLLFYCNEFCYVFNACFG